MDLAPTKTRVAARRERQNPADVPRSVLRDALNA